VSFITGSGFGISQDNKHVTLTVKTKNSEIQITANLLIGADGGKSSIVWSLDSDVAVQISNLSDQEFCEILAKKIQFVLGDIE